MSNELSSIEHSKEIPESSNETGTSAPESEKYLKAFADKKELICLDHKRQNKEPLTKEDLEFLYEINRPICTLDAEDTDPRIQKLRSNYNVAYALKVGVDPDDLVSHFSPIDIAWYLDTLIEHGANLDDLVNHLSPIDIVRHLDTLLAYGADPDKLEECVRRG